MVGNGEKIGQIGHYGGDQDTKVQQQHNKPNNHVSEFPSSTR